MKPVFIRTMVMFIFSFLPFSTVSYAAGSSEISFNAKKLIQNSLTKLIPDMNFSEKLIEKYFSQDYVQHVDGITLNYRDFVDHMKKQKSLLASAKVTIKYIIAEGNQVSTLHIVDAIKKNGESVKVQVNAFYRIKDNKIILVDELTHMINGNESDRALASSK